MCVQLGWGLILLFHSCRVTNRINLSLPTEQGDTLAALFEESVTSGGSATDPIVHQSLCIHADQQHGAGPCAGRLHRPATDLICASHAGGALQRDNKLGLFLTFSELQTLEIRRVNLCSFHAALIFKSPNGIKLNHSGVNKRKKRFNCFFCHSHNFIIEL